MEAYLRNISVEAIGPEEAQAYLDTGNCDHVNIQLVYKYVSDMKFGKWSYPGGVIEITAGGNLKDGHHRLLAITLAGIVLPMIVVRNVSNNGRH